MVAYNFQGRFADMVEAGTKRNTIRQTARCKVGDRLQLYTGQRTSDCRKLVDPDPTCDLVMYVALRPNDIVVGNVNEFPRDRDEFAKADGFTDYADMHGWFAETYKTDHFVGKIIRWVPASPLASGEAK